MRDELGRQVRRALGGWSCCVGFSTRAFGGRLFFFFSSRRRHTRSDRDWSSDVCSSDLAAQREQGERRTFLLALLAIYVGAAFTLFALRGATLKEGAPFELISRETGQIGRASCRERV